MTTEQKKAARRDVEQWREAEAADGGGKTAARVKCSGLHGWVETD